MWIVQVEDGIAEQRMILPTGAADRQSTEPLLIDFVEQWAAANNVDLNAKMVHCCTGEEHNHDPLVVVKEHGDNGKMLLHIICVEVTHVVSATLISEDTAEVSIAEVGEHLRKPIGEPPIVLH